MESCATICCKSRPRLPLLPHQQQQQQQHSQLQHSSRHSVILCLDATATTGRWLPTLKDRVLDPLLLHIFKGTDSKNIETAIVLYRDRLPYSREFTTRIALDFVSSGFQIEQLGQYWDMNEGIRTSNLSIKFLSPD